MFTPVDRYPPARYVGTHPPNQWGWVALRAMIEKNEVRNSPLVAKFLEIMNALSHKTSNIYTCRVLSVEFVVENWNVLADGIKFTVDASMLKPDIVGTSPPKINGLAVALEAMIEKNEVRNSPLCSPRILGNNEIALSP
nr:ribonucleoside-diphosphate reductase large subunit [Ipomoea batatas]